MRLHGKASIVDVSCSHTYEVAPAPTIDLRDDLEKSDAEDRALELGAKRRAASRNARRKAK